MHLDKAKIDQERIAELERAIDDRRRGARAAARLHPALAALPRRRRCTWRAPCAGAPSDGSSTSRHEMEIPPLVVIYLNRLSDLLFTLARLANKRASAEETTW